MRFLSKLFVFILIGTCVTAQVPLRNEIDAAGMALIPGAVYDMGLDAADVPRLQEKFGISRAELFADEVPRHRVTVRSFYIDRTEVTNAQFKRFLEQNPEWRKVNIAARYHNGKYLQHWKDNDFPEGQENYPVVFVSWYAAAAYCKAQGKRLPTEAEWEFAARGGVEGKTFPWGDDMPDKTRANYSASGINGPTAVASYPANGYGLHDMAGNVWEYLADEWTKYSSDSRAELTELFKDRAYLSVKSRRALRGGSYGGSPVNMRITYRDSHLPENAAAHVGFRCAATAPVQSNLVNEILRMHYQARGAHFNRDAKQLFANMADEYFSVGNGRLSSPDRALGQTRMQEYLDASTFLEWDDITPPVIRVSDDGSMAYAHVYKKVRLVAKDKDGNPQEETEIFAWTTTYKRVAGKWKVTSITSTNTPQSDK